MRDEACDKTKLTKILTKCCLAQRGAPANPVFSKQAKQRSVLISCFVARNKEGVLFHLILSLVKLPNTSVSYLVAEFELGLWYKGVSLIGALSRERNIVSVGVFV